MDRSDEKYSKQLEMSKAWKKANPERHAELAREYRLRNLEKTKAQNLLNYAIRSGRMERGMCEVCGTAEKVHAHHHDYRKPYDVKWLCFLCHKKSHPVDDEDKRVKFDGAKPASLDGVANPNAALSEKDVLEIRAMLEIGISQTKIAQLYGVHQGSISRIKLRKVYANIPD